jgi:starvation-inducible DNA-binding protein
MTVEEIVRTELGKYERAVPDMQDTLVELIELAGQAKQVHWNVVGALFKPVHLQLDDIVDIAREASDEVAERIVTIGGLPDGRTTTVAQAKPFAELPAGAITAEEAVKLFVDRLDDLTGRLRQRVGRLGDTDPISQGMLIAIGQRLEKELWMLRAQRA